MAPSPYSPETQARVLEDLQELYLEKGQFYAKLEGYWRGAAFKIAIFLGVLPILVSVTELLPEKYRRWVALLISLVNIIVVVFQLKLDIGEKIADASMAQKTFNNVASSIDVMKGQLHTAPDDANVPKFLNSMQTTLYAIEGQMKYPIAEKKFRTLLKNRKAGNPVSRVSVSGTVSSMLGAGDTIYRQSFSKVQPEVGFDNIGVDSTTGQMPVAFDASRESLDQFGASSRQQIRPEALNQAAQQSSYSSAVPGMSGEAHLAALISSDTSGHQAVSRPADTTKAQNSSKPSGNPSIPKGKDGNV